MVGDARPPPFTIFTKVAAYAPAEYTLTLFHLYQYCTYSMDETYSGNDSGKKSADVQTRYLLVSDETINAFFSPEHVYISKRML
jgi:hypothetical protein